MLSATAVEEKQLPTQFDMPSYGEMAFMFSELISSKVKDSTAAKDENREELQKELTFLTREWRQQEVTNRIASVKNISGPEVGEKIASRLKLLRAELKEEEGKDADISPESLRALQLFMQTVGKVRPPEITLTPEAEVYLRWKSGRDHLFAVHLVNGRMVRYVIFAPNPRHSGFVRRFSGIETSDTVLETARYIFPNLDWIKE